VQSPREPLQPGPTIFVGKRRAGAHLFDIGFGVVAVAIKERHVQAPRDGLADRRLARGTDAHDDDDAGRNERHGYTVAVKAPST
jgi:hypothetical protein